MSLQELQSLKADCNVRREAVLRSSSLDPATRTELAENLYPLLDALFELVIDELDQQGAAIEELIDQSDNVLHPELTAKIIGVFELGKAICLEAEVLLEKSDVDDLAKKRFTAVINEYRRAAEETTQACTAVTVELDDFDDDGYDRAIESGDDDDDDEDGDDADDHADAQAEADVESDEATGE